MRLSWSIPTEELFTAEVEANQSEDESITVWQLNPDTSPAYVTDMDVNVQQQ